MRRLQFDFEDALKSTFSNGSKSLDNTPQPPGPISRWIMADGDKFLVATDQSLSLSLNFQNNRPQHGAISVAERYSKNLDSAVRKFIDPEKILFSGIVMTINLPCSGSDTEMSREIARLMITTKIPLDQIVSASASIGYTGTDAYKPFNFHYNVVPYKLVNVQLQAGPDGIPAPQSIDTDGLPSIEKGLAVRIDVNDRILDGQNIGLARKARSDHGSLSSLIPACREACNAGLKDLFRNPDFEVDGL